MRTVCSFGTLALYWVFALTASACASAATARAAQAEEQTATIGQTGGKK